MNTHYQIHQLPPGYLPQNPILSIQQKAPYVVKKISVPQAINSVDNLWIKFLNHPAHSGNAAVKRINTC